MCSLGERTLHVRTHIPLVAPPDAPRVSIPPQFIPQVQVTSTHQVEWGLQHYAHGVIRWNVIAIYICGYLYQRYIKVKTSIDVIKFSRHIGCRDIVTIARDIVIIAITIASAIDSIWDVAIVIAIVIAMVSYILNQRLTQN